MAPPPHLPSKKASGRTSEEDATAAVLVVVGDSS